VKQDHLGFFIFLFCLLIAPEISLGGLAGLPGRANLSLGLVGLIIWIMLSPKHLIRVKRLFYSTPAYGMVVFSIYSLLISFVSQNMTSMLYASQFFVYAFLVFRMVSGYLVDAVKNNQLKVTSRIFLLITSIVIIGTILSVWLGPIYPEQAFWRARKVEDRWIQRAVGFTGNPNSAGAILLLLVPLCLSFLPSTANRERLILALLGVVAILTTFSRSAILSGAVAICVVLIVHGLKALAVGRVKVKLINTVLALIVIMVLFMVSAVALLSTESASWLGAFGLGADIEGLEERVTIWNIWYSKWTEMSLISQLFGAGFRSGAEVSIYGTFMTPHNFYIEVLFDFGIFGLLLFILPLVWAILHALARVITLRQTNIEDMVLIGMLASAIHNMSETFFYSPAILSLILILMLLFEIYVSVITH